MRPFLAFGILGTCSFSDSASFMTWGPDRVFGIWISVLGFSAMSFRVAWQKADHPLRGVPL